ncbi:MAG: hypothetical protein K9H25_23135 [Rhodospirillum sp.]|nr:hypothetical protein [Rhodospirillum sp.]MCF8491389.1 hypothetical protein [Rhodospirillum sp.]MCF8503155.1 hypothetical protein [Rhodospirillum sp.]
MDKPDWVTALAEACDASSQRKVAKVLEISAGAVNALVNGTYKAKDWSDMEDRVRAKLMNGTVQCPGQGQEIPMTVCGEWRAKAQVVAATSGERVRMRQACLACGKNGG